jgi:hypothetical protein
LEILVNLDLQLHLADSVNHNHKLVLDLGHHLEVDLDFRDLQVGLTRSKMLLHSVFQVLPAQLVKV